jgi:hypothetical protein
MGFGRDLIHACNPGPPSPRSRASSSASPSPSALGAIDVAYHAVMPPLIVLTLIVFVPRRRLAIGAATT